MSIVSRTYCIVRLTPNQHRGHLAIRWLRKGGEVQDYTYADLGALTSRFANVLRALGVARLTGFSLRWMPANLPPMFGMLILGPQSSPA